MNDPITAAIRRVNDRVRTLELWVARQRLTDSANAVYDNTGSGLTGDTVQDAIDEVAAYGLDDLSDVTAPTPASGDGVVWNGSAWVNEHALTESDVVAIITPTIYFCDSIAIEAAKGTLDAGAHTDLHAVGGTAVHVSETGTTPGFELRAAFSAVDGISNVYIHGYYTGNHTATIDIYNYDTVAWDTLATFTPSASATELLNAAIVDSAPYRDGSDNALIRFYHAGAGNPTHDLYLDYLALSSGGGSAGPLALDDLTDVNAPTPADGDVLTWDDYAAEWVAAAGGGPGGSLTVEEVDGTPSDTFDTLIFPNGTLTDNGDGSVTVRQVPVGFIGARAYHNTTQTVATDSWESFELNSESWDTDGFHDTVTNNSRMTVPAGLSGKYVVTAAYVIGATDTDAERYIAFAKNGTRILNLRQKAGSTPHGLMLSDILDLAAGDYVEVQAYQDSGSTLTVEGQVYLAIAKLDAGRVGSGVGARAYNSAAQGSLSSGAYNVLTLDSEDFDTDAFHSVSTNTGRLTIPTGLGGKYLVTGFAYDTSGACDLYLMKNGNTSADIIQGASKIAAANYGISTSCVVDLAAGDYVQMCEYHASGTHSVGGTSKDVRTTLSIMRLDSPSSGPTGDGGDGNAPDGTPWNFTPPASPTDWDDEFNDGTNMSGPVNGLDSKWSKHNLGTASWLVLDEDYAPGCLFFDIPSGQSHDQSIYQTVPSGAWTIACRANQLYNSSRDMWGPFVVDSSGNGIGIAWDSSEGPRMRQLSAWNQTGTVATFGLPEKIYIWTVPATMYLHYPGSGTTYYGAITYGDRAKYPALEQISLTYDFTDAYIGYGRIYAASNCASKHLLDYFRVVEA